MNAWKLIGILAATLVVTTVTVAPGDTSVPRYVISSGGGLSQGGVYVLTTTIGQVEADPTPLSGGIYSLVGGFEAPGRATPFIPGDANGDGVVDIDDFATYDFCLTGPATPSASECDVFDFDGDGDVDLVDFAGFSDVLEP